MDSAMKRSHPDCEAFLCGGEEGCDGVRPCYAKKPLMVTVCGMCEQAWGTNPNCPCSTNPTVADRERKEYSRPTVSDHKPSNPKDAIGATKLPMHLIPGTALAHLSLAFLEGALKYGKYNWRVVGVRASIYLDAMKRHIEKWENGQDGDEATRINHLASVMACCAIILDATNSGKLTDDRPPSAPVAELIDAMSANVKHLQELFADQSPHQHTIGG